MMMRCMMILLLLMISVMPAWASEKPAWLNDLPSSIADEYQAQQDALTKHNQAKNESPLSKLYIESEEWHEGSTQYIRYTFTKPTNTLIQEKIAYTRIIYEAFTTAKPFDLQIHATDAIRELVVEPNSSASITVSIPQKAPIIFVNQLDTTFFLNEYDSIYIIKGRQRIARRQHLRDVIIRKTSRYKILWYVYDVKTNTIFRKAKRNSIDPHPIQVL